MGKIETIGETTDKNGETDGIETPQINKVIRKIQKNSHGK